jgi:hypothetical protein
MGFLSKLVSYVTGTGPKGGKFYTNSHGNKEYGTPPKAAPAKPKKVAPRAVAAPKAAKAPPAPRVPAAKPKKAPAGRPAAGVHPDVAKSLAHLPKAHRDALLAAGFGELLARHPVGKILYKTDPGEGSYCDRKMSGRSVVHYVPATRSHIASDAADVPSEKSPTRPWATTANSSAASPLIHEMSHHLHFALALRVVTETGFKVPAGSKNDALIHAAYSPDESRLLGHPGGVLLERIAAASATRRAVSRYALTSPLEWFAETHMVYSEHKNAFTQARPTEAALMRDVRRYMGMPE